MIIYAIEIGEDSWGGGTQWIDNYFLNEATAQAAFDILVRNNDDPALFYKLLTIEVNSN